MASDEPRICRCPSPASGGRLAGGWEWAVAHWQVPPYVVPAPSAIARAFADNFASLMAALLSTLTVTLEAFAAATVLGTATAIAFSQSRLLERLLYPYAVILQVTPVVAIAPLILIWVGFERNQPGAGDHRHHRRLLPDIGGRGPGPEKRRLRPDGPDPALRRLALAEPVADTPAHRAALSAVGHEDRGRAGADRRGGGRVRRRQRQPPPAWPGASWNPATGWRLPRCSPRWLCWPSRASPSSPPCPGWNGRCCAAGMRAR